jgi:hypothetical protein
MHLFLPALYLLVHFYGGSLPICATWGGSAFLAMHSRGLERLGVPDLPIYVPCFLASIFAYKLTKTRRLNLHAVLWPLSP